ncbi:hypothetical protein KMC03_gp017 [Escherichia phage ECO4]|uniref:Uncharacterized protein n=1 Tax=Escherichia phage ECO4 TaxID=2025816 RepID=A0A249XYQ5_9CAUD|nr:hypothetical protein KMC03_gp017 [Escherichia phage ECO4]ASZ77120.1 hypothetical protein [Escherichia phage ECO4]
MMNLLSGWFYILMFYIALVQIFHIGWDGQQLRLDFILLEVNYEKF